MVHRARCTAFDITLSFPSLILFRFWRPESPLQLFPSPILFFAFGGWKPPLQLSPSPILFLLLEAGSLRSNTSPTFPPSNSPTFFRFWRLEASAPSPSQLSHLPTLQLFFAFGGRSLRSIPFQLSHFPTLRLLEVPSQCYEDSHQDKVGK